MKTFIAILLSALVGFGSAWYLVTRRSAEKAIQSVAAESEWQNEKAFLEQSLSDAKRRQVDVRTVMRTTSVTNKLSATEILEKLVKLNPNAGEESRNRTFRQIVYHLQMLVDLGPEALPVIHGFLKQNKDVDYSGEMLNEAGERVSRGGFASRNSARTDFLVPPSLRLGLVDVLDQIGGEDSEGILAELLDTTGRGVEVAYIARLLQEVAPDKFRDNALRAAKDLLSNPPAIDQPNRLDENARGYLYQVLAMYNDTSFAENAQALLVTPEGRVDRQALAYLNNTLKEQSVSSLYAAYKNPRLTNQTERGNIMNAVLNYAGPSTQANDLFKDVIADESIPSGIRAYTIQGLAGGTGKEKPSDPQLIQARLQLLQSYRGSLKDERLLKSIDDTRTALEAILAGQVKE
jgi:hypothetical protein